jgi:hypothetical protein
LAANEGVAAPTARIAVTPTAASNPDILFFLLVMAHLLCDRSGVFLGFSNVVPTRYGLHPARSFSDLLRLSEHCRNLVLCVPKTGPGGARFAANGARVSLHVVMAQPPSGTPAAGH